MNIAYYFSSPEGDVPVDDGMLARPFILHPFENHAFMTLGDYFMAIKDFILRENGRSLTSLLTNLWDQNIEISEIDGITIRYEKYGTLYQIASVEILALDKRIKFAVNTAISLHAKETLDLEFNLLQKLNRKRDLLYLPRVYYKETMSIQKEEKCETPLMALSEWFEDYHEWHFSKDENGRESIIIWDMGSGWRFASVHERYEIIKQASRILTLYYDMEGYHRISPWHHGAGDFIVKTRDGIVDVKLVTVRGYEPIAPSTGDEKIDPSQALILFLLNMSVKMRLDKWEGMGESFWAEASILKALMDGFFDALRMRESEGDVPGIRVADFTNLLKSISEDRIKTLLYSHMDEYRLYNPADYTVIETQLAEHVHGLYSVIQGFTG